MEDSSKPIPFTWLFQQRGIVAGMQRGDNSALAYRRLVHAELQHVELQRTEH